MVVGKMFYRFWLPAFLLCFTILSARAQSFQVQCPNTTITHLTLANNNSEPAYTAPTTLAAGANAYLVPNAHVTGAIKCQPISGGDGLANMVDGSPMDVFR